MTIAEREAVDETACREARAMARFSERRNKGRIKHWELRHGLEKLETHRRFNALFRG